VSTGGRGETHRIIILLSPTSLLSHAHITHASALPFSVGPLRCRSGPPFLVRARLGGEGERDHRVRTGRTRNARQATTRMGSMGQRADNIAKTQEVEKGGPQRNVGSCEEDNARKTRRAADRETIGNPRTPTQGIEILARRPPTLKRR
jgi:hypothetical protein